MDSLLKETIDPAEDYYKLLNCDEKSTAEQIEVEFKVLAKRYHPDKVSESSEQSAAEKKFIQIDRARKVLLDKEMREKYDQWRNGGFRLVVSFKEWLTIQPRVHTSIHWITTQKSTPSLPEPPQSECGSHSTKRDSTEDNDELPPTKRPRTEQMPTTLLEFRRGSEGSTKVNKFRNYQE